MSIRIVASLATAVLALLPALASAMTVYDFQNNDSNGVTCTTSDLCSQPASSGLGGTLGFAAYPDLDVTAMYLSAPNTWSPATVVQDRFTDAGATAKWVGLGVYSKILSSPTRYDNSDDNITKDEKLILTFDNAVVLTKAFLRADGHFANFQTDAKFEVSSDGGNVQFSFQNGINSYDLTNSGLGASKMWTFYGLSNETKKQYYVSAVTVVPEPEAYGLALAGMGVVAFALRRKRATAG